MVDHGGVVDQVKVVDAAKDHDMRWVKRLPSCAARRPHPQVPRYHPDWIRWVGSDDAGDEMGVDVLWQRVISDGVLQQRVRVDACPVGLDNGTEPEILDSGAPRVEKVCEGPGFRRLAQTPGHHVDQFFERCSPMR